MSPKKKTKKAGKRDGQAPKVEFGRLYRDDLTGYEGRCAGFTSYISGCDQVLLVPKVDDRLIDVEVEQKVERTSERGGPQQAPIPRLS
jgi:hypothetical protein